MKKFLIILFAAFLVMFSACSRQDAGMDMQIAVPVSVEELKPQPIQEYISATGTVYATKVVELNSETNGYYRIANNPMTGKPFQMGDQVKKDQVIVFLDNPELENSIAFESQKLNLEVSESEYTKQQSLYEKGGVTFRELKNAEISYIDAKYSYENAVLQLAKTKVIALFDGVIVDLPYFTSGTRVETGVLIVELMDYRKLYLELSLPGKELGRVDKEQPVRIMNYMVKYDTLNGNVTQVAPALDPDSRSFKVAVEVDNAKLLFRPGMFVKSEIIVASEDSALVVPKEIILARGDSKRVFVVEKGAAEDRRIVTGIENPFQVQVLEGLKENDRIIIKGYETLRDHSKVKIIR